MSLAILSLSQKYDFMEVTIENIKSPDFKQIYAIGAIGGHSPYDFRMSFYNDTPKAVHEGGAQVNVMERKMEVEVILSPMAAKELAEWLNTHVRDYEKMFGEIKKPGKPPESEKSSPIQGYM